MRFGFGGSKKKGIYLGSPEAEGDAGLSRMPLVDLYEDYHGLVEAFEGEKFILVARKGCGKSAFAEYVCEKATDQPNFFASFVKKRDFDLEKVIQIGQGQGIALSSTALIEWVIYVHLLKLVLTNNALNSEKDCDLLRDFLRKNSGYVEVNELQLIDQVRRTGFDVNVEPLRRYIARIGFARSLEVRSARAAFFQVLPHLRDVLVRLLRYGNDSGNGSGYILFFDDLDLGFSAARKSDKDNIVDLLRVCKDVNADFRKAGVDAKAVVLLRDDIQAELMPGYADTAKMFSTYVARVNWYQDGVSNEDDLNIKQFIVKRISRALGADCDKPDPWLCLVSETAEGKSTFKHVLDQTRRFLRFSGHPELTLQESSDADAWSENDVSIQP